MIRNKVLGSLLGRMEEPTREAGKMESKMEKEHTGTKKDVKRMEYGWMVKKFDGRTDDNNFSFLIFSLSGIQAYLKDRIQIREYRI